VNATPVSDRVFISMAEGAQLSGYSIRQFRRVIAEHRVPIQKFGHGLRRKYFILAKDFNLWLEKRQAPYVS
jgi:hypothetical protein